MLVLDDMRIAQVHSNGVSHPSKTLLYVIGRLSRFVQENASPDSHRVCRILLLLILSNIRVHGSRRSSKMEPNPGTCQVGQDTLLQVAGYRQ